MQMLVKTGRIAPWSSRWSSVGASWYRWRRGVCKLRGSFGSCVGNLGRWDLSMTEVNFPGARRSGMYVETEERPEPDPVTREALEGPADPFVEPVDAEDVRAAREEKTGTNVGAPVKVPAREADAEADDEEEPAVPAKEGFRGF